MSCYIYHRTDAPPSDFLPGYAPEARLKIWRHSRRPGESVADYRARQSREMDQSPVADVVRALAEMLSAKPA